VSFEHFLGDLEEAYLTGVLGGMAGWLLSGRKTCFSVAGGKVMHLGTASGDPAPGELTPEW